MHPVAVPLHLPPDVEGVACTINLGTTNVLIVSVYRPPTQDEDHFVASIVDAVSRASLPTHSLVIAGDTNLNAYDKRQALLLDSLNEQLGTAQVVPLEEPTHKKTHIDHIFVRRLCVADSCLEMPIERHHATTRATLVTEPSPAVDNVKAKIQQSTSPLTGRQPGETKPGHTKREALPFLWRRWTEVQWDDVEADIYASQLTLAVEQTDDPNVAWRLFKNCVQEAIDAHVPSTWISPSSEKPKWFSRDIRQAILRRNKIWRKLKICPIVTLKYITLAQELVKAKRKVRKMIQQAKRRVFDDAFKTPQQPKRLWRSIREITRDVNRTIPTLLDLKGKMCVSDKEKADALCAQYCSVFTQDEDLTLGEAPTDEESPHCSPLDMYSQLSRINPSKACGPDGLPGRVLKNLKAVLAAPLAHVCNLALKHGQPSEWLTAHVVPIPKKRGSTNPQDYRPIALLCIAAKCYERFILSMLEPIIESVLPQCQFGFRKHMGTSEALLSVEAKIQEGFKYCQDRKSPTAVHLISIDFSKAFDRVPHSLLLKKLKEEFSFPSWALRWATNHLTKRSMSVRVNGTLSDSAHVSSGCPQGAPSSAPLFNASIAAIGQVVLSQGASIIEYADDLIYVKPGNDADTQARIEEDLEKVHTAAIDCGQQLNTSKTTGLLCSVAPTRPTPVAIMLDGQKVEYLENMRYLGVYFDARLNMQDHLSMKISAARRLLGATLSVLQRYGQTHVITRIWLSVIKPMITYGLFMTQGKTARGDARLERLQMTAARACTNKYDNDDILLRRLGWDTIERQAWVQRVRLAYNYAKGHTHMPSMVFNIAPLKHSRTRRKAHDLQFECTVKAKTESLRRSGFTKISQAWNALSQETINLKRAHFKRETMPRGGTDE